MKIKERRGFAHLLPTSGGSKGATAGVLGSAGSVASGSPVLPPASGFASFDCDSAGLPLAAVVCIACRLLFKSTTLIFFWAIFRAGEPIFLLSLSCVVAQSYV